MGLKPTCSIDSGVTRDRDRRIIECLQGTHGLNDPMGNHKFSINEIGMTQSHPHCVTKYKLYICTKHGSSILPDSLQETVQDDPV